jgi:hypothetical protein
MAERQLCSFHVPVTGFEVEDIADTLVDPDTGVENI